MYCFVSLTDSALLSMVGFASFPLLVHHCWACFVLFYFTHWFIIIGHDLYCSSSSLIGSCLLGIVCIVLHPSLVHHYQAYFALFYFLHWLIIIGNDLYCFISSFTGSSLLCKVVLFHFSLDCFFLTGYGTFCFTSLTGLSSLGMAFIVSFHASSVHQYRVWFTLFHLLLHLFIIIGHGL